MGARKRLVAEARKEAKKTVCDAKAVGVPTSPRKMRLLADVIREKNVLDALNILTFSTKHASKTLEKLVRSAVANWEQKFETKAEESELFIAEIKIDSGRMLKRFQPAPQGRAYRIRKRSNHVTLQLASRKLTGATLTTEENNAN
ncbi:MAG TPA: 50S ribosomal protein L22 [Chitinophagales bacterium]|nr:50S ribosomal protein L22 [Chitinophagales bacterium]